MIKKIVALLLCAAITFSMTACGNKTQNSSSATEKATEETTRPAAPSFESTEDIINAIYEKKPMELNMGSIPVDLTDEFALQSYLGLTPDDADKLVEATASEAMMGQACSIVTVELIDASDAGEIAQKMANGIDQNKWICVEADNLRVVTCDKYILLVMISSSLDSVSVDEIVNAFTEVCGYIDGEYYKK
ncbi:MAG: hypothetical protein PUA77_03250 [Lachnospiraceae bacterium]|nr:hypothetical protein [Lachnospiraceae bacterium]